MTQEFIVDTAAAKRSDETAEIMRRYNDVFQRHDPSALAELVAQDCVIENTTPAPDGARRVGKAACVELWSAIATAPGMRFDLEETFVAGDRATIRWRFLDVRRQFAARRQPDACRGRADRRGHGLREGIGPGAESRAQAQPGIPPPRLGFRATRIAASL